jgi:hypothetical protein
LFSACITIALLLIITRFLSKRRKQVLLAMEFSAAFLLFFDRLAYMYSGVVSSKGFIMVRVSNFFVFFLTSQIVLIFNLFLADVLHESKRLEKMPKRLYLVSATSLGGMLLVIVSQFTGWIYYFDEFNTYHRGSLFLLAYVLPVLGPLVQYTIIRQNRRLFGRFIYMAMNIYIFGPILMGIIQIFTYGISIVNMAMVLVSIALYVFTYLDINETVIRAHKMEMKSLQEEKKSMKRLFDQTATAFVTAIEKRDMVSGGHSAMVADYAKKIAQRCGKTQTECENVFYAALLHDVGTIGIPDSVLKKEDYLTDEEYEVMKQKPVIGSDILSQITEYPFLKDGARYSNEWYDGTGYPDGIKGNEIPEVARIVAVAGAYVAMTSKTRKHDPLPYEYVKEEFLKKAGTQFDPLFAATMIQILDSESNTSTMEAIAVLEKELHCGEYRTSISSGIPIVREIMDIHFQCRATAEKPNEFSAPSIIIYDSFDGRVHEYANAIEAYRYLELGEVWFDGHFTSAGARNMEVSVSPPKAVTGYTIQSAKYEDHIRLIMDSKEAHVEVIIALPASSNVAFLALTGEHCALLDIAVEATEMQIEEGDIRRIAEAVSYIDRMESDLPNVQVDRERSAATQGVLIKNELLLDFHSRSLPASNLVWHCPYLVLFYSEDGKVFGPGYREYALLKLNGELEGNDEFAVTTFRMKKTENFKSWDFWKRQHKDGLECSVTLKRRGAKIHVTTENLGVLIDSTTSVTDGNTQIYAALTGERCALTDIRVR